MNRILPEQSLRNLEKGRGWNKGKKHTDQTKKKISEATQGRVPWNKKPDTLCRFCKRKLSRHQYTMCIDCYLKFDIGQKITGTKKTKIQRKRVSEGRKRSPLVPRGENHPSWKGGVTPENEKIRKSNDYGVWRASCLKRDSYTCQKCGTKSHKLNVHHIKEFADNQETRMDLKNGITYCVDCHKLEHSFKLKQPK